MRRAAIVVTGVAALFAASKLVSAEAPAPKAAPAQAAPGPGAPTPAALAERPPPYQSQLLRMAEMMGALAFLRDLCGLGDGADYRAKMAALLSADGISESQRDLLAGAYNKGFQDYGRAYRKCTPNARVVISRYLSDTAKLSSEVASRYGGG